ncbi:hypothetical protein Tco_0569182 [Tanacetum coccineum]
MANLEFCDKHNMVAYLKKPTGSEGFQEIVDFLNGSHIRYALTTNPTIYVSLIEIFWQTATVRTIDNEEQEITATVDGKEFTITEASVRRHLQLADADGISVLPNTEIFDQLLLMGEHTPLFQSMLVIQEEEGEGSGNPFEPQPPPSTAQPTNEEPIPNVASSSHQKTQSPRQALQEDTQLPQTSVPIPNVADEAAYEEWDDRVERATTTAASLDAQQGSGGSPRCQEATGGSIAQTSMTLHELTILCTKLSNKVESLETELKQTKQTYGAAFTKLIKKVKKLEQTIKTSQARKRAKIVVSDDEEASEDSSKQGRMMEEIDQDAGITLVTPTHSQEVQPEDQLGVLSATKVLVDAANVQTYTRRRKTVSTASGGISTAGESISTVGASMPVSTAGIVQDPSSIVVKDKGKAKVDESKPEQIMIKLQQRQERLGLEAAMRLQEQFDKEERQRIARVHEEVSSFNVEEWEDIQATIEADEELALRIQVEEREKYSEAEKARLLVDLINQRKRHFAQQRTKERRNKPLTQAQQRTYMSNYVKHMGSHTLQQLKRLSFDELKNLFEATMKRVIFFTPMESDVNRTIPKIADESSKRAAE